jgi:hypothetical protein
MIITRRSIIAGLAAVAAPSIVRAQSILPDWRIEARKAMDDFYGAGNWSYRTAPGVGTDLGAALNAAMAAAKPTFERLEIIIPPTGKWRMTTPIAKPLITGNHIHGGAGPWGTLIYYDSDEVFADIEYTSDTSEGGLMQDLIVVLEPNHPNGKSFVRMYAQSEAGAPGGYVFNRVRATADASSSWQYTFVAHGMVKQSPPGIRGLTIRDCMFFRARQAGFWGAGINQLVLDNVQFAVPAAPGGTDLWIGGGGTPTTNSHNIALNGVVTIGASHLSNCQSIMGNLISSSGLTVDSTVTKIGLIHDGTVTGSPGSGFITQI